MWNILITLFILSSVAIIPNVVDNFWIPKNVVFIILGFSLLGYNFISQKEKTLTFKNKWIGLILIYIILSFSWYFYRPIFLVKQDEKIFWNVWNFLPTINVILAIFIVKDLIEYTDSLERWVKIAKVLCWVCFCFSIYAFLQFFGLDQIFTKDLKWIIFSKPSRMITFMGNSMHTANFITILSPLCLMFKEFRYKIFYLMTFITLILIDSTLSMFAFIIGFLIYLLFMKQFKFLGLICLSLLTLGIIIWIFYPQYFSLSGRPELWKITLKGWLDKPYTGWGLGNFSIRNYQDHTGSIGLAAENDYLHIGHDGGLFLFMLVCGYLYNLFKRIMLTKKTMLLAGYVNAFIVYLIIAGGSFIVWITPLALTGIIYMSAIEVQV